MPDPSALFARAVAGNARGTVGGLDLRAARREGRLWLTRLPPQNGRLGDPALSDFERVGRETALSLESDRATGRYADPVL
jgi:hypothetical protein